MPDPPLTVRSGGSGPTIAPAFVEEVTGRIRAGLRVRRTLPVWGRLHVDRQLPFLVVYRRPEDRPDEGTARLVTGAAVYLTAPTDPRLSSGVDRLVEATARALAEGVGKVLVVEVWARAWDGEQEPIPPGFEIRVPGSQASERHLQRLSEELGQVQILKRPAQVRLAHGPVAPPGMTPLFTPRQAASIGAHLVGIEVEPVHQRPGGAAEFPVVRRDLKRQLTTALGLTFFEFARTHTPLRPTTYQALGRRAMVKAVWDADRALASIAGSFDLLLLVSPSNVEAGWSRFRRDRYQRAPAFLYRPLPIDPALTKRRLYAIEIERVEDPTLAELLRLQRANLDRQVNLLSGRESPRFLHDSLSLYGAVEDELQELAERVLAKVPRRGPADRATVDADGFAERAREELARMRAIAPDLGATVEVRPDVSSLIVSGGNLLVGSMLQIPRSRVDALIQHEVGTHVLTNHNGGRQPLRMLASGLGGYEALQEGMGVLAEFAVGGLSRSRLRLLAGRVLAVRMLAEGADFVETFRALDRDHGFTKRTAYTLAMRVHRGGGFAKDAVYLRGLREVAGFLAGGGSLEALMVGKIAIGHEPITRELLARKVLHPPALLPSYLDDQDARRRLGSLGRIDAVDDLLAMVHS